MWRAYCPRDDEGLAASWVAGRPFSSASGRTRSLCSVDCTGLRRGPWMGKGQLRVWLDPAPGRRGRAPDTWRPVGSSVSCSWDPCWWWPPRWSGSRWRSATPSVDLVRPSTVSFPLTASASPPWVWCPIPWAPWGEPVDGTSPRRSGVSSCQQCGRRDGPTARSSVKCICGRGV